MNMQALINSKLFVQTSAKVLRRSSQGFIAKQSTRQYASLFQRASVTKSTQEKLHQNFRKTTIISPFGSNFSNTFRFYVNEEFKKKDREREEEAKQKDEEEAEEFRQYQQKQKEKEDMKRKIEEEYDDDDKKAFDKLRKEESTWDSWFGSAGIPIIVGILLIILLNARRWKRQAEDKAIFQSNQEKLLKDWQVDALKKLPTRVGSRIWGYLTHLTLPVWMRKHVYGAYASAFGCNLDEMEKKIEDYPSLAAFFARHLKEGARPIDPRGGDLFSPVDARVLHYGMATKDTIEQIKGVRYSLPEFLGDNSPIADKLGSYPKPGENVDPKEKRLYYCLLYLAPGDYHGIHSPTNWTIESARHFPGHLFSVSSIAVRLIKNLFVLNERICLNGKWDHGYFSLSPVGAYNVGSIELSFDKNMKTNVPGQKAEGPFIEKKYPSGVPSKVGDEIAFFHLGSSIVLVFESPEFLFTVKPGQKVQLGQRLGMLMTPELSGIMESVDHETRKIVVDYRRAQFKKFIEEEKKRALAGERTISRPIEEIDPDMPVKEIEEFLRQTSRPYRVPKVPRDVVEAMKPEIENRTKK